MSVGSNVYAVEKHNFCYKSPESVIYVSLLQWRKSTNNLSELLVNGGENVFTLTQSYDIYSGMKPRYCGRSMEKAEIQGQ
jgi:hypothetical protein